MSLESFSSEEKRKKRAERFGIPLVPSPLEDGSEKEKKRKKPEDEPREERERVSNETRKFISVNYSRPPPESLPSSPLPSSLSPPGTLSSYLPRSPPPSSPPRKKIMLYSDAELQERKRHFGSTLSVIDRKKFEKDFDVDRLHLSSDMLDIWHQNPHLRQVFANKREFLKSPSPLALADRIATQDSGRRQYKRRQGEAKTVCHWGQRKLIMSEIEFLTTYGSKDCLIIYAGAAPGTHTNFLSSKLFPHLKFLLVDPARFDAKPTDKIQIINDFFDDEMAEKYKNKAEDVLFICDIRSMQQHMNEAEKEARVAEDMQAQRRWHNIMKPKASMLKFRLPYKHGTTEYLAGDIYFQVFAGRTSSETRLIVTTNETKTYCHSDYEDLLYYFNTITRTKYWPHNVRGEGLDHCYDCAGEIYILQNYLRKIHGIKDEKQLVRETAKLSQLISERISNNGRCLLD